MLGGYHTYLLYVCIACISHSSYLAVCIHNRLFTPTECSIVSIRLAGPSQVVEVGKLRGEATIFMISYDLLTPDTTCALCLITPPRFYQNICSVHKQNTPSQVLNSKLDCALHCDPFFFFFEVYMSMEPKAIRWFRSLCLKALVPSWNYEVSMSPHFQPIETD